MKIVTSATKAEAGKRAAASGAAAIRKAIKAKGRANIIVATGASQFEMLEALVQEHEAGAEFSLKRANGEIVAYKIFM